MLRITLRELLANKVRLLLTAVAIVLGVGFVSGSYVLGDTLNKTFDEIFEDAFAGTDVIVRSETEVAPDVTAPISDGLVSEVAAVDGVAAAEGGVLLNGAVILDRDGDALTTGGAPQFGASWATEEELNPYTIKEGRPPATADEVVIDAGSASDGGYSIGDRVAIITQEPTREFELVGIAGFGDDDNLAGATTALWDLETAQRLFGLDGQVDSVSVAADEGVSVDTLVSRIDDTLPSGVEAVSAQSVEEENANAIKDQLSFLTIALQAFGFIAVFVAAFIIFNTFSITVAQRVRRLALLRAVGASGAQVTRMVMAEAVVVGVLASVAGLFLGLGVAAGLQEVFKATGFELPTTTLQFLPRTIIVSLATGIVVTLIAAYLPARKAAGIPPVSALREGGPDVHESSRSTIIGGTIVTALGAALFFGGPSLDDTPLIFGSIGVGALLIFVGVAILSQVAARPLASWIGRPLQSIGRVAGKLGRENAMRDPRRTARTAAALMIGLALVAVANIFSASLVASTDRLLDDQFPADFIIRSPGQSFTPFSPQAGELIAQEPGVGAVAAMRFGQFQVDEGGGLSRDEAVIGSDPAALEQVFDPDFSSGGWGDLTEGGVAISEGQSESLDVSVGDSIDVTFARSGDQTLQVQGIFKETTFESSYFITLADYEQGFAVQQDTIVFANAAEGVSIEEAQAQIDDALTAFPNLEVQNQNEFKQDQQDQINQLLTLVFALLALTIIIAIFGIVNTLALTIFERTREIGLLRAVGLSPGQSRWMVVWEAVIVGLIGGVLGLALGVVLGAWLTSVTPDLLVVSVPWPNLIVYLVLSAIAGVLAAALPARRASKLNVLRAIAQE